MGIYSVLKDIGAVVYPEMCIACRKRLLHQEKTLCLLCRSSLPTTNFHNDPDNPVAKIFWGRVPLAFAAAFLYFSAKGKVQKMIHFLKYKRNSDIGILLGKLYGLELAKLSHFNTVDFIVPVPLHPKKLKKRGYNQSEIIARGLSAAMQIPVDTSSFARNVFTETQTKKSKYKRWENVDSIFGLADSTVFEDKHILLVDDVITTGATIEACAQEILKSKGARVSVVALATAMRI